MDGRLTLGRSTDPPLPPVLWLTVTEELPR
jgi:hypothetical protein